jgi:hypothetical protein
MSIVLHLIKKDLRHIWIPLAVWLALLVLSLVLIGSAINPGDSKTQNLYQLLSMLLPLFQALTLIAIIPSVIQEDSPVGTTAFWLTRPITRATLLQSKTLFLLLILLLPPLVAELIVLAANGASPHYLGLAVPEIIIGHLTLITLIAYAAAVTPNFGRFAIFIVALVIGASLLEIFLAWSGVFSGSAHSDEIDDAMTLLAARWAVCEVVIICVGWALIIFQYLTRHTVISIVSAFGGIFLFALVFSLWNYDFLAPEHVANRDLSFHQATVKVALTGSFNILENPSVRGDEEPTKNIRAQITITGVPQGYVVVQQGSVDGYPTLQNGAEIDNHNTFIYSTTDGESYRQAGDAALQAALGDLAIVNPSLSSNDSVGNGLRDISLFEWSADTYHRYATVPLKFSAKIKFIGSKYLFTAEMPLVKGARYDYGAEHGIITSILHEPNEIDLVVRVSKFNLLFDRDKQDATRMASFEERSHEPKIVYLLVNKVRHEALVEKSYSGTTLTMPTSGRLINTPVRLYFGAVPEMPSPFTLTPEWLANATLVRMELTPVAEFSKEIAASKLILEGPDRILVPVQ